jgi:hypothetical protein
MGETWWDEVRWRVVMQVLIWAVKIAPSGTAKLSLINAHLKWITQCAKPASKSGDNHDQGQAVGAPPAA